MHFEYSTPGRFIDALKAETDVQFPLIKQDFYPYN